MTGKEEAIAIERCAADFGVPVSSAVRDALLVYGDLLMSWGQRINLTASKSAMGLIVDHLPDAFAVARRLAYRRAASERIVDIGSGGGLPALPLALLRPDSSFVLVEATGKKVAFLRTAVRTLGLGDRVQIQHGRVERPSPLAGSFDVAVSRATLPPPEWLPLGLHLVRPGGAVFCLSTHRLSRWAAGLELTDQTSYRADRWVAELTRST